MKQVEKNSIPSLSNPISKSRLWVWWVASKILCMYEWSTFSKTPCPVYMRVFWEDVFVKVFIGGFQNERAKKWPELGKIDIPWSPETMGDYYVVCTYFNISTRRSHFQINTKGNFDSSKGYSFLHGRNQLKNGLNGFNNEEKTGKDYTRKLFRYADHAQWLSISLRILAHARAGESPLCPVSSS